ncbi:MAG TPA: NfeD family protein [Anaerolineaceae bacterium]
MDILLNPNVAYLLLVGGFLLAILALFSPGTGLLELGALFSLLLAGYSIYNLPINFWALALLIVGVIPFVIAVQRWKRWPFLLVSMAALIVGSVFLFRVESGVAVHPALAGLVSVLAVGLLWLVGRKGLEAVVRPSDTLARLMGMQGEARTAIYREGAVYVNGEIWTARSSAAISPGTLVRVIGRDGLVLVVEPAAQESLEGNS